MGKLIYLMNVSLDGFIETPEHSLDWTTVDEEIHTWFNDQLRETAALLYGRRLYELMAAYWPHAESDPKATDYMVEFGRTWVGTPKIVFSSTLTEVDWNSRLVRADPVDELPRLRAEFDGDLSVAGPTLAAAYVRADLVDEYRMVVHPVILGAGTPFFPSLEQPIDLEPTDSRRFRSGARYLGYRRVPDRS
jgi:dihydrofolate reductase